MPQDERDGGTNARPLNDTVAQTGPGIADDALLPGEAPPEPVDEREVERVKDKLDHLRSANDC